MYKMTKIIHLRSTKIKQKKNKCLTLVYHQLLEIFFVIQ